MLFVFAVRCLTSLLPSPVQACDCVQPNRQLQGSCARYCEPQGHNVVNTADDVMPVPCARSSQAHHPPKGLPGRHETTAQRTQTLACSIFHCHSCAAHHRSCKHRCHCHGAAASTTDGSNSGIATCCSRRRASRRSPCCNRQRCGPYCCCAGACARWQQQDPAQEQEAAREGTVRFRVERRERDVRCVRGSPRAACNPPRGCRWPNHPWAGVR